MTQQDDITQRVPKDDETQALIEHDRWFAEYGLKLGSFYNSLTLHTRAAWIAASKLRAPVARESVCKGSMALGSGCGACERCKAELAQQRAEVAPVAGEAQPSDTDLDKLYRETVTEGPDNDNRCWENPHRLYARAVLARYAAPQASADVRNAMRNLIWAASERDKGNRIRQFDQFMDEARAAISLDAANQGSRDE